MEAMKKYIDVTREVRQDIMAAFNVTGKMVYYALNFDAKRGESDKASASVYMPSRKVAL